MDSANAQLNHTEQWKLPMSEHRIHGLDFSRALMMIMGVFYHAGLAYSPTAEWRVSSNETHYILKYVCFFLHNFRMEAFFIISGYFYHLISRKRRPNFLKDRALRVLIPLLVFGLLVNPFTFLLTEPNDFQFNLLFFRSGQWMAHLWFLATLFVFFLISMPACALVDKLPDLGHKHLALVVIAIPIFSIAGIWAANAANLKIYFFIMPLSALYFYPYFLLGILFSRNGSRFLDFVKLKNAPYYAACYTLLISSSLFMEDKNHEVSRVLYYLSVPSLVLFSFCLLMYIGGKSIDIIRRISDASFTIYLLHEPFIIVSFIFIFDKLTLPPLTEYLLLTAIVTIVAFLIHDKLVSKHKVLRILFNGNFRSNQ